MKKIYNLVSILLLTTICSLLVACGGDDGESSGNINYAVLDTSISEANAAKVGIKICTDGNTVNPADEWVTEDVMDVLNIAIEAAESARANATTQRQIERLLKKNCLENLKQFFYLVSKKTLFIWKENIKK